MRRSGRVGGVVALVLAVALGAGVFAGCGGEAELPGIAPSALEHRDTPRAVAAEEEPQQEEAEPAFNFAAALAEQNPRQTVYTVLDGEGGIHQVFTRGVGSGFTLLRVSTDEYRCSITVRQSVSDEAAGHFALRFSEIVATGRSGGQARQNESWSRDVEVTGPSWEAEFGLLVVDAERFRNITVRVSSDASDAKWVVDCKQAS